MICALIGRSGETYFA